MNLLCPAELRILYVWVEAVITIENFSTQEKMSHTPTQNTVGLVILCGQERGIYDFSFGLCPFR